jgi:molybdenum cofactor guanylyltransferase
MGRDKALLPFCGVPLARWVAGTVAEAAGSATLIGSPETYGGLGFPVIPDLYPGEGPLGGILTALRDSGAEWNLIVACDMPELNARLLRRLLEEAKISAADALLPVTGERPQPLCAVYRRACLGTLDEAFSKGVRAVTAALAGVRVVRLPMEEMSPFQNVNTPEDWAAYAS